MQKKPCGSCTNWLSQAYQKFDSDGSKLDNEVPDMVVDVEDKEV